MAENIDPQLFEDLTKLGKLIQSANQSVLSFTKSATAQAAIRATNEKNEQARVRELIKSLEDLAGGAENLSKEQRAAIRTQAQVIAAEQKEADQREKTADKVKKFGDAAGEAVSAVAGLAQGVVSTMGSVYGAEKVFSGVTPVVDLLGSGFKALSGVVTSMLGQLPLVGGFFQGANKVIGAVADLAVTVTKFKLEAVQKLFDSFQSLQKSGLFLAGNFDFMRNLAQETGLTYAQLNKFVTSNIESLSHLGGGLTRAAQQTGSMAKRIGDSNDQLLMMYGSYEDLAGATASYASLIAQSGNATMSNTEQTKRYLVNLKEVSELTGLNAESIKKEQEARLKQAAFQIYLQGLDREAQDEVRNRVTLITSMYGKEAGDYLAEYYANQGRIISKQGLLMQAQSRPLTDMLNGIAQIPTGPGGIVQVAKEITGTQASLMQFAKDNQGVLQLNSGVQDEYIQQLNSVVAAIIASNQKNLNAAEVAERLMSMRNKDLSDGSKKTADAIRAQQNAQKSMDAKVEQWLPQMGKLTEKLYVFTNTLIEKMPMDVFDRAVEGFADAVDDLLESFGKRSRRPVAPPVTAEDVQKQNPSMSREAAEREAGRQTQERSRRFGRRARSTYATDTEGKFLSQVKAGESGALRAGGSYDPDLAVALNKYVTDYASKTGFGVTQVTSLDDLFHAKMDSKHNRGTAVDFTLDKKPSVADFKIIEKALLDSGFRRVLDEYNRKSDAANGDHIHAELAHGAVVSGGSGGIVARVGEGAKDELVTPLVNGMMPGMRELLNKVDALVRINSDQLDHLAETKNLLS